MENQATGRVGIQTRQPQCWSPWPKFYAIWTLKFTVCPTFWKNIEPLMNYLILMTPACHGNCAQGGREECEKENMFIQDLL